MLNKKLFAIPQFRYLFIGQMVSMLGDALYYSLFMFMVNELTKNSTLVGYVSAAETIPFLIFSAYAGVLADRYDRRLILIITDLISLVTLSLFAVLIFINPRPPVAVIYPVVIILSTATAFFIPARLAALPRLVPPELFPDANSLWMTCRNIMPMISLALSASVVASIYAVSPKWFFLAGVCINALTFAWSAFFSAKLPSILPLEEREEQHPWTDFVDGLRYIRSRVELKVWLALGTAISLSFAPFFVVYLKANEKWFGNKPGLFVFTEFCYFAGVVAGSFLISKFKIRNVGMSFIAGTSVCGLAVLMMAFSRNYSFYCVLNVVAGLASPLFQIPISTYIAGTVPDQFRGRVNSTSHMLSMGVVPIGAVLGGKMLETIGISNFFMAMGSICFLASAVAMSSRRFRQSSLDEIQPSSSSDSESVQKDGELIEQPTN